MTVLRMPSATVYRSKIRMVNLSFKKMAGLAPGHLSVRIGSWFTAPCCCLSRRRLRRTPCRPSS
jgi:hypothetical protein